MKAPLITALSLLALVGCEMTEAMVTPDPVTGVPPIAEAFDAGLDGLQNGGIIAGVIALAFTTLKTIIRVRAKLKAEKDAAG